MNTAVEPSSQEPNKGHSTSDLKNENLNSEAKIPEAVSAELNTSTIQVVDKELENLISNLRVSRTIDRLPVSRALINIDYGNQLNDETNKKLFESLGFSLGHWKKSTMSLFTVLKNDSERTDLCRNIIRAQLSAIPSGNSISEQLPLNLMYQKLKLISSEERKVFITNYFDLHLNKETAADFAQQHIKRFLRYFNNNEKSDLIHWLCAKGPSSRRSELIFEIFQSCKTVESDLNFLVEKTQQLTELKKDKLIREFYALAEFKTIIDQLFTKENRPKEKSKDKITKLETSLRNLKEQISNVSEYSKSKTGNLLIQICNSNLKNLKELKANCTQPNDFVRLYRCFDDKITFELKYGILIEADASVTTEQVKAFGELSNQAQEIFEPFSELFFYTRGPGLKIKFFKKLVDEETGVQFGCWDHRSNTISLSLDTLDDMGYLKEIGSCSHLQATLAHEIGHYLQLGNNSRFKIATNEERVIYKLVNEELAQRNINFERVIALLARSDDFKSLSQVINDLDKEQIEELENPQLSNLCARIELLAILQLNQPPTKLAPSANSKIIGLYKQQLNDYVTRQIEKCRLNEEYSESKFAINHMEAMLRINHELNQNYEKSQTPAEKRNLVNLYRQVIVTQLRYGIQFSFNEEIPAHEDFKRFIREFLGRINESHFLIQEQDFRAEFGNSLVSFTAHNNGQHLKTFNFEIDEIKKKFVLLRSVGNFNHAFLNIKETGKELDQLISEKQKRVIGSSRPEVDFDEFLQIAEWKLISPRDYELKHGMNIIKFQGHEYQLGLPLNLGQNTVIFVLSNDMLFTHNANNEAHRQFPPSYYAKLDPWENFAETFAWYCLQPKDLITTCPKGFIYMEGLMNLYEKNRNIMGMLQRVVREKVEFQRIKNLE